MGIFDIFKKKKRGETKTRTLEEFEAFGTYVTTNIKNRATDKDQKIIST